MSEAVGFYALGVFTFPVAIAAVGLFFEAKDAAAKYMRRKRARFAHIASCSRCLWEGYAGSRRRVKLLASEHICQYPRAKSGADVLAALRALNLHRANPEPTDGALK